MDRSDENATLSSESSDTDLQFEAASGLTNTASGSYDQTVTVARADDIPKLANLLRSKSTDVAQRSVWQLCKIASVGPVKRDEVLNCTADILEIANNCIESQPLSFSRKIILLLSILCRNKNPTPPADKVRLMLPILAKFLSHEDNHISSYAAEAISYITDIDSNIQSVIDIVDVGLLKQLLSRTEFSVVKPALRLTLNLFTVGSTQVDAQILVGLLESMQLLFGSGFDIVKEVLSTINNIISGNSDRIATVCEEGIFADICVILQNGKHGLQKEAAAIFTSVTSSGDDAQISEIFGRVGALQPFCDLMSSPNPNCVLLILSGIENLLVKKGRLQNVLKLFKAINGIEKLDFLQTHQDKTIREKAVNLVETHFAEINEVENLPPKAKKMKF